MECFSSRAFSKESTTSSTESTEAVKQHIDVIDNVFLLCFLVMLLMMLFVVIVDVDVYVYVYVDVDVVKDLMLVCREYRGRGAAGSQLDEEPKPCYFCLLKILNMAQVGCPIFFDIQN